MAAIIQFRRDTAANWTSNNPTMAVGEIGYETDNQNYKIGDGVTAWTSLGYGGLGDIHKTLIDAKGDLVVGLADNSAGRLAVGTNGQMLVADSDAAGGISWAANDTIVNWHEAVKLASAAAIAAATSTYDNGTSGVGATLTHTPASTPSGYARLQIDGTNVTTGDRILIQDQVDAAHNGIYEVTAQGVAATSAWVLTRGDDFDGTPTGQIKQGEAVYALSGSNNSGQGFTVTSTSDPHTVGTHDIDWTQFTGTQAFNAGTGLTITGNTVNANTANAARIVVNADDIDLATTAVTAASYGSVTEVGTFTVDAYGRLTAAADATIAIPSTAVTDFTEAVQDVSGAQLATNGSHTGITASYDDAGDGAIDLALVTENVQDIVAGQLVTNGSHSGIAATYDDAGDGAIDLNVDDFTITLAGDLSGNTTITNLANATLTATIVADATALGTDTTGNYVATIAGTANEVEVSGSGSETAAVTVGLPSAVTVTTSLTTPLVTVSGASIVIEGATANDFETTLTVTDPTADRTITFADASGTVVTTGNLTATTEYIEDTVGAQLVTNGSHTHLTAAYDDAGDGAIDIALNTTAVTGGSYGSATAVPGYTVDAYGRLTAASNTTIAIPSTAVTDFTEAVQDVSGAQLATNGSHTGITATYDDAGDGAVDLALITENVQDIVAGQLVTNGSHSGIAATYDDAGDGAIDLNVDDFTITLSGDIGGSVTVTNLASATLATTIQADSIALGTDTTGNYLATLAGTANEVEVSGSGSETAAVTVGLPSAVTVTTSLTTPLVNVSGASIVIEGATANDFETTLTVTDPTADRTITLPDVTGTVITTGNLSASTEHIEDTVAAQLVTNGSHSGIAATYDDAGDGAIDLNVADFTITLSGDIGGSVTVTDLASATLATTIQANSVALGTDSTGNYVATVAGTANEVDVSGSGSETAAVTIGLPSAVTVTTSLTTPLVNVSGASIVIEGATANDFETTLTVTDPTADRTITFGDETGTVFTTASVQALANGVTATTQSASDNSTKLATTAYVDTGLGALSSDSITDADSDTKIQVEESADEDIIRFDTAGTERMTIGATGTVTITGDLTVNGTTTEISSTTITVDDKNIEIGSVASPTDVTADGGGLTLKGATDKTWNWVNSTDAWTSSEHIDLASGKAFYIAGASVLNATTLGSAVVASSLTSVGTIASLAATDLTVSGIATFSGTIAGASPLIFEGATANDFETTFAITDPTADRTITFQDATGTVAYLASPTFTGTPAAPTASANTGTTQIATTAFVMTELADYAPLVSPTLQGTPLAPTAAADTNTTQIATTAYVQTELGAVSSDSLSDADGDTKIQVEEGSDDDTIRFDVAGTQVATMAADVMTLEGNNNRTVQVKNTGGAYAYVTFQDTNTTAPSAGGGVTGANRVGCQTNDLVFYADGEEKGRFIADKGLTFNGDTAAANALDDYEEGTWTASFVTGGGTVAPNTSYDTMNYTKIGRLVNVSGNVDGFTVSSPTGSLQMTGLPYAVADTAERSDRICVVVTAHGLVSAEDNLFGEMHAGTGIIFNYGDGGTGGGGAHMATIIDAGTYVRVNATYTTAT